MSAVTEGNIEISASNYYIFTNTSNYDMLIYTTTSNQRILMGTLCNGLAPVIVDSNASITTSLAVGKCNPTATLDVSGTIQLTGSTMTVSNALYTYGIATCCNALVTASNIVAFGAATFSNTALFTQNVTTQSNVYVFGQVGINTSTPTDTLTIAGSNISISNYGRTMIYGSNNNLGLGTANPLTLLHINGDTTISGNLTMGAAFQTRSIQVMKNTTGAPPNFAAYNAPGVTYNTGSLYLATAGSNSTEFIAFLTGSNPSSEKMRITGNTGYVGIGTTTPSAPLHVAATSTQSPLANGIYCFNPTNTANQDSVVCVRTAGALAGNPYVSWDIAGDYGWCMGIDNADTNKLKIGANYNSVSATTRMTIDTAGYVGIGTSNPVYTLDVNGNGRFVGGVANKYDLVCNNVLVKSYNKSLGATATNFTNICTFATFCDAFAVDLTVVHSEIGSSESKRYSVAIGWMDVNTNYYRLQPISSSGPCNSNDWAVDINVSGDVTTFRLVRVSGTTSLVNYTCSFIIYQSQSNTVAMSDSTTTGTGATNLGMYTSTPLTQVNGCVGVGTAVPSESVHSTTKIYSQVQLLGPSNDSVAVPSHSWKENSNTGMFHPSNNNIGFTTGGAERVRINDLGYVGIGLSNPGYPLDVVGTLRVSSNLNINRCRLCFSSVATDTNHVIYNNAFNIDSEGAWDGMKINCYLGLAVRTGNAAGATPTTSFYVNSTGTGIGTTTPSESLHSINKIYSQIQLLGPSNDSVTVPSYSWKENSNTGMFHASNNMIGFATGGTERARLTDLGYIGIGTSNPGSLLSIAGGATVGAALSNSTAPTNGLMVQGAASLCNNLNVYGTATISNVTTLQSNVVVAGTATFSNNVYVLNPTSLSNTLNVSSKADFSNAVMITSNLWVNGAVSLSNNLSVYGTTTISNVTTLQSNLVVAGAATFNNDVTVIGKLSVSNITYITSNIQIYASEVVQSNLSVYQAATLCNNVTIYGTTVQSNIMVLSSNLTFSNYGAVSCYTSNSYLGVGISNPSYKLDVAGDINFTGALRSNGIVFTGGGGTSSQWSNNLANVFITGSNVGIGTTAPSESLHSTSKIYSQVQLLGTSNDSVTIPSFSWKENSNTGMYHPSNNMLGFTTGGVERARINDLGYMGVGISNPSYQLHVGGTSYFGGNMTFGGGMVTKGLTINMADGTSSLAANGINPWTSSSSNVYISASNVGIGTASPSAPLHVTANSSTIPVQNGIVCWNPTNSTNQHSIVCIRTGGSLGGNPFLSWDIASEYGWSMGIDNADGNKLKIGANYDSVSTTTRMTIDSSGNVGIATASPGYKLEVSGAIYASGDISALSDKRFKDNITPISNSLETINNLQGYSYTRNDYDTIDEEKGKRHIGLIAQDVEAVLPEVVTYDKLNDKYGVNYGNMAALFVEAIKDLKTKVESLETVIGKQDAIIQQLLAKT